MSEEAKEAAPAKGRGGAVMIAAVLALLAGSGAGIFVVGPKLAGGSGDAAAADDGHGAPKKEKGGHGGGGGHGASPGSPIFAIENLVVNPAGTQGTRFLIATVALEAHDAETATELNARDPEIRDALLGLLSRRTVEELSDLGGRDTLKDEILATVESLIGKGRIERVFIPQYVLQ